MEEYVFYGKVKEHMRVSEALYEIDLLGKHILDEIRCHKNTRPGRRGVSLPKGYETMYSCINETINLWRFKSRLFLTLQYYLDEALFDVTPESIENFYIEDDSYNLTKLYFDQEQWIRHNGIQRFTLTDEVEPNVEDALLINSFFMRYESLMKVIEGLVTDVSDEKRYKRKILQVITRIRGKHIHGRAAIEEIIKAEIDDSQKN